MAPVLLKTSCVSSRAWIELLVLVESLRGLDGGGRWRLFRRSQIPVTGDFVIFFSPLTLLRAPLSHVVGREGFRESSMLNSGGLGVV